MYYNLGSIDMDTNMGMCTTQRHNNVWKIMTRHGGFVLP